MKQVALERVREAARNLGYELRRIRPVQTHCKRGHELAGDNVYHHGGKRHCRACRRDWRKRSWQ